MGISNSRAADNRRQLLAAIRGGGTMGNVFYVDSTNNGAADTAGRGRTPTVPFATIDFAIGQCTASNDDFIIVMPGHTETVVAESGIAVDVIGINIIGMGNGTLRPTITFSTTTTSDMKFTAANCRVENLIFTDGFDAHTGFISFEAADCSLIDCEITSNTSGSIDYIDAIIVEATGDRTKIIGLRHWGGGSDTAQSCIQLVAGAQDVEVAHCEISGTFVVANIECLSTTDRVRVHDNMLLNTHTGDTCIHLSTTATGFVYDNYLETATDAVDTAIATDNDASLFQNFFVNLDGEAGGIVGVAST